MGNVDDRVVRFEAGEHRGVARAKAPRLRPWALLGAAGCAVLVACTVAEKNFDPPLPPTGGAGGSAGEGGVAATPGGEGGVAATPGGEGGAGAAPGGAAGEGGAGGAPGACEDGALSCAEPGSRELLICEDGDWVLQATCSEAEICDDDGLDCAEIPPECVGRAPGEKYCEGETRHACSEDLLDVEVTECDGLCVGGECAPITCGDGSTDPGEECDDGNDDDGDACTSACRDAECGDGFVWQDEEECDDGDDDDADDCTSACEEPRLPPSITSFEASSASLVSGESLTLSWDVSGAEEVTITPEPGVVSGASVSLSPTQTTTYTLTATNAHGSVTATVHVAIVSGGRLGWIRHYEHSGYETNASRAASVLFDPAKQRLITANVAQERESPNPYRSFVGEHSLQDGALLRWSEPLSVLSPQVIARLGSEYLIAGSYGQLLRLNGAFEELDYGTFEVAMGGATWEATVDLATTSDGGVYGVGLSLLADDGFIAHVPADLGEPTVVLTDSFLDAIAVDARDRVFVGGRDGFLARYSVTDLTAPAASATLQADDSVTDVAIDSSGDVVTVGTTPAGGFVAKFRPALGSWLWRVELTGSPQGVAVDAADNVIVLGSVAAAEPEDEEDRDLFVDAFRSAGERLWDRLTVPSTGTVYVSQVIADERGNVYIAGGSSGELRNSDDYAEPRGAFLMRVY